ncbi:WD40-repeat-containing domain protein [Dichotomocladium elegans]|nr:WD40-repeat-containing domain protein [Dichotomocladium elegans]
MVASNDDLSERSTRLSEHGALSARRKSDEGHPNAIWAMEISSDGKYLAAAGQHGVIKIWSLNDHAYGERDVSMTTDGISSRSLEEASIKVFNDTPLQEFAGHSAAVLDLSWSKTHFLLSSSMDNRVILWHASMKECLCVFQHSGSVTSVAFHPVDDRIFLSGSLDGKVRIWSVPDRSCVACSALPDDGIVTAVGFAKDGKLTCAGSSDGQLFLYETEKLKFISKMAIKKDNSKKGQKITAIQPMPGSAENVLVTSNDSYIRLIKVTERQLLHHYKGADNEASQIRASFSDDGSYVICGSDKSTVHVWRTGTRDLLDVQPLNEEKANASPGSSSGTRHLMDSSPDDRKEHRRLSSLIRGFDQQLKDLVPNHDLCFSAHEGTVTCAIFAPRGTRQRLAITGNDAIYNFTPVVYARYDKNKPNSRPSETNIEVSEHVPDADKEDRYQQQELLERAQYSYSEGHIIVTADESGIIKVWRVDSGVYGSDKSVEHEEKRAFSGNTSLSPECISRTPPSTSISNRFKEFIKRATR